MSVISTILTDVGLGGLTGSTQPSGYTFSQQQKDFLKAQFKLALLAKQQYDAGNISYDVYQQDLALASQQLDAPYTGFWTEFKAAIDAEDLNWLANQVGETIESLTQYMGSALGKTLGSAVSGITSGVTQGFFGSLNIYGWLAIAGVSVALYWGIKKGYVQKALKGFL